MPELVVLLEQLLAPVPGGTGRYTRELAAALAATSPAGWTVRGAVARHADHDVARVPGVAGPRVLPLPRRALVGAWERGLPLWPGGNAVHAPTPFGPPSAPRGAQLVVTVHDAVPWSHPGTLTRRGAAWHRRVVSRAARRADALVVPTAAVAAELARQAPGPAPVHVIGEGVTAGLTTEPVGADAIAERLRLPPRYLLAVGTLEPRKGLDVLLTALAAPHAPSLPLLLVGPRGWGAVAPGEIARGAGLAPGRVRELGRIGDEELAVVLHRAAALAAPSLAEGFGLPVLEAMAAGVPVVHSDAPALLEVAGGAGSVVPRGDAAALAAALHAAVIDPGRAAAMAQRGRRRAEQFSWRRAAEQVWTVHTHLWSGRSRR